MASSPFITSDPHAWLRPYYARLSARRQFSLLETSLQFRALVETVAYDQPGKAAEMQGWNDAAQRAVMGWLADVVAERPATAFTELWRARKGPRELHCIAVYLPTGIDLRLMEGDDFVRTELLRNAVAVRARADTWREKLSRADWA